MTEQARNPEVDAAQIANLVAEAKKYAAEEEQARQEARLARLQADEKERTERNARHTFDQDRIWYLNDAIGNASVRVAMDRLHQWDAEDPTCDMQLWITSPGGSVHYGMALFDFITALRRKGHHITTVAMGVAASMGAILLQAGDRRVIGRESFLLVHEVSWGAEGKVGELEDATKWMEKVCGRVARIFVDRSNGKMSLRKFTGPDGWKRKDWWIDSDEALRLGFVDEVW